MAEGWRLERGACVVDDGVRFSVWAPRAGRVELHLGGTVVPMEPADGGVHVVTSRDARVGDSYAFSLDGGPPRPDPVSRSQPAGVHGPSRIVDPRGFPWSDARWTGRAIAEYVLYELHVGTFTAEGTFDAIIPHLAGLRDLGVTAIELMPVAQFPGARNWGYDGVDLYAVQASYGGSEGLRRLVDAAHAADLAVVLDVVYNHVGPEGNYLAEFGPYFTDRYRTPWGAAINYDDAGSDEVRRFILDNVRHWIAEYHVDGLRLDAIQGIFDTSPTHILAEIGRAARAMARAMGRTAVVIGESDLNDPRVVRCEERGGYALDGQWADDLHHVVHATITGEASGYYADYTDVASLPRAFQSPYLYEGQHSAHRGRRHGAAAGDTPRDRFVVASQNHDQVGNRARGDRLTTLVSPERRALATALVLLSPYVPLLFMGEEYGETNPFQYFVSHSDPALLDAVRVGRQREFASFGWDAGAIADPASPETFARSRLDRAHCDPATESLHRELLAFRQREPAMRPGASRVHVHGEGPAFAVEYEPVGGRGARCCATFNAADSPSEVPLPDGHRWVRVLGHDGDVLPPFGFAAYRAEGG